MDWFKGKSEPETIDFPVKDGGFLKNFPTKPIHLQLGTNQMINHH
jgi:hypothetical protein